MDVCVESWQPYSIIWIFYQRQEDSLETENLENIIEGNFLLSAFSCEEMSENSMTDSVVTEITWWVSSCTILDKTEMIRTLKFPDLCYDA